MTYLRLFGGGVVDSISAKNILAASLLAISMAVPSVSIAQTVINKEPVFVSGGLAQFLIEPGFSYDINLNTNDGAVSSGIDVSEKSELYLEMDSLNIHYEEQNKLTDNSVYGIKIKDDSFADITATNDIDLRISADKSYIYGIYTESTKVPAVSLISKNGSININVSGTGEQNTLGISGIRNASSGTVKLDAGQNIEISATTSKGIDYTQVYAIENQPPGGSVELSSDGYIKLYAQGYDTSYGILNGSVSDSELLNSVTLFSQGSNDQDYGINIKAVTTGLNAYAVQNQYGSIDLTAKNGGIYLSATGASIVNSSLYSTGGTVNVKADGKIFLESKGDAVSTNAIFANLNTEDSFLIHGKALSIVAENNSSGQTYGALTIDGFASLQADELANIKSSQYGLYSYAVGSQSKIDLTGSANKIEASSMALVSYGEKAALNINASGERTVIGENSQTDLAGTNFIIAPTALWASNGVISLKANKANHIDASSYGLYIENSGTTLLDVTNGVNRIEAGTLSETEGVTSGSGSAIYTNSNGQAEVNSPLGNNEIFGYIQVQNGQNSKATLTAGNNFISSNTNTIRAYTNGLVSVQANKTDQENSGNNFFYSKYANGYGEGLAIQALSKGSVKISAQETNSIFGAISSKNEGSSVSVDGKTNTVKSYAVISNAGNLSNDDIFKDNRVISALYAEGKGAQISLTGEQNYLSTFADSNCSHRPRTRRLGLR